MTAAINLKRLLLSDAENTVGWFPGCPRGTRRLRVVDTALALATLRFSPCTDVDFDELQAQHEHERDEAFERRRIEQAFGDIGGVSAEFRDTWKRIRPHVVNVTLELTRKAERHGHFRGRCDERARCLIENRQGTRLRAPDGTWGMCRD